MCIGVPMRVTSLDGSWAYCSGRGLTRRVNTLLVEPPLVGDWLLIFQDRAVESIDTLRAQEVNAALDLLESVMQTQSIQAGQDLGFELPSRMSAQDLAALTNQPPVPSHSAPEK